jgi:hypothetical protein
MRDKGNAHSPKKQQHFDGHNGKGEKGAIF